MEDNNIRRRTLVGGIGAALIGGVGIGAAATSSETVGWFFTIVGAERQDARVTVLQVSTSPAGRAVEGGEILIEGEANVTIDILVTVEGESVEDTIEGVEVLEGEQKVVSFEFGETVGSVDDGELQINIEEVGLEAS